jgi:hypothetical protein
MSTEATAVAVMLSFAIGMVTTMWMGQCSNDDHGDAPADAPADAGRYDAHWNNPGIACLERETQAVQDRMYKAQEKLVMLQTQIDVLSGAYALREQLSKAGPGEAQRIANAVVLDAGSPERLTVALKYLKDDGGT